MSGYSENILSMHGRLEPGVLLLNKPFPKHELAKMVRTGRSMRLDAGPQVDRLA